MRATRSNKRLLSQDFFALERFHLPQRGIEAGFVCAVGEHEVAEKRPLFSWQDVQVGVEREVCAVPACRVRNGDRCAKAAPYGSFTGGAGKSSETGYKQGPGKKLFFFGRELIMIYGALGRPFPFPEG
jgi:hypothetical protein